MKIHSWKKTKRTIQSPQYLVSSGCQCGCSPFPFVFIFDGKIGITVEFDSKQELASFQHKVKMMGNKKISPFHHPAHIPIRKVNPSKRYPQCPYCGAGVD